MKYVCPNTCNKHKGRSNVDWCAFHSWDVVLVRHRDASIIGLFRAGGTRTKADTADSYTQCVGLVVLWLSFGLKSDSFAHSPFPPWSVDSSYLINGVPAPVFIDFPKLGFHRWQSSCHPFPLLLVSLIRAASAPQSPSYLDCNSMCRYHTTVPPLFRNSRRAAPITVLPRSACS